MVNQYSNQIGNISQPSKITPQTSVTSQIQGVPTNKNSQIAEPQDQYNITSNVNQTQPLKSQNKSFDNSSFNALFKTNNPSNINKTTNSKLKSNNDNMVNMSTPNPQQQKQVDQSIAFPSLADANKSANYDVNFGFPEIKKT